MKRWALAAFGLFFVILLVSCNNDNITVPPPQLPTIASITPNEVSRAERGTATISGANFTGARLVFIGNEVTIEDFRVVNANTIEVDFIVNSNASAGKRPVQVQTAAGITTVQDLLEVKSNRAPVSEISFAPQRGATNTTYTFDALQSKDTDGAIVSYAWEFGDGKRANGPIVKHKYGQIGEFRVKLTVKDDEDAQAVSSVNVEVREGNAPAAKFSINPQAGDVNTQYTFNASASADADGTIDKYLWNFGTKNEEAGAIVTHNFPTAGIYLVTLTVRDNDGLENSIQKSITVGDFDEEKAAAEIRGVINEFFRRFALLTELTAEQIVTDWSDSSGCPGRAHEITIILKEQQFITKEEVRILGSIDVEFSSPSRAHAIATAQFDWEETDGSIHSGQASHDFTFIFEDGEWHVCDFIVF